MGWKDAPEVAGAAPAWAAAPEVEPKKGGFGDAVASAASAVVDMPLFVPGLGIATPRQAANAVAGAVRGAGSIGATLLYPVDKATDLIMGDRGPTLSTMVTGKQPLSRNEERRADMTEALKDLGADTDSFHFGAGKLGAEVAGTGGVGGGIANTLARVPAIASKVPALLNAIRTGGMAASGEGGVVNAITRAAGGAINGGASAGLVDPSEAVTGAVVGGALPAAVKAVGATGNAVGKLVRGPEQAPDLAAAIAAARGAGYVVPPTQAKPTFVNRVLEGIAGKQSTAQNASARNQAVTNRLAADALGLPADTQITPDVLKTIRDKAGAAYEAVANSGVVTPRPSYGEALDKIAAPFMKAAQGFPNAKPSPVLDLVDQLRATTFDAGSAVAKIRELRTAADDGFRTGNTDVARAAKAAAGALEDALDVHLATTGNQDLLKNLRDARTLIAKTYSVEKALNPATGTVDARNLAAQAKRGKPLSSELRQAADFAARFPKAAQPIEGMGSLPQTSPLDWAAGGATAVGLSNPLALAGVAARPAARAAILSGPMQKRLIQSPQRDAAIRALFATPEGQALLRAAPVAAADQ